MTLFYSDDSVTLHHGDALATLRELPDESVNCCVTSPPYYGLRDYGEPGQYGLEETPAAYVEQMRQVFAEVRRVLTADGTLWLNLGDSYAAAEGQGNRGAQSRLQGGGRPSFRRDGATVAAPRRSAVGMPPKNLLGIPWRVAFALQDDGWILRNHIAWHKPNAMPESVKDRLSSRHESLFLLAKSDRYWFDLDAIREPHTMEQRRRSVTHNYDPPSSQPEHRGLHEVRDGHAPDGHPLGRNPGDVWSIPTVPFAAAHFAVFPPDLAERCVRAGCKPSGVVLDTFAGSGTTGMVAGKLGRRFVGIDLSAKYLDLALRTRLAQQALIEVVS